MNTLTTSGTATVTATPRPSRLARRTGIAYLGIIATGIFAEFAVPWTPAAPCSPGRPTPPPADRSRSPPEPEPITTPGRDAVTWRLRRTRPVQAARCVTQFPLVTVWTFVALAGGLASLVGGAEVLVKGAAAIATRLGVAPVIIGLTVVAFGTSAPELAVSVGASVGGDADVALGNVVGSNIGNVLLILGASAIVGALAVDQRIVRLDIPLLIAASVATLLLGLDNEIGRLDGLVLFTGIVAYTVWLARAARRERSSVLEEYDEAIDSLEGAAVERPIAVQVAYVLSGLALLVLGSQLLVGSAVDIAEELGVSDLVIGLTVVAIGTSLPELATSLLAALRGQRDLAVGNVVGSNLFNLLCVLGLTGLVVSDGIPVTDDSLRIDLPVMLACTIVLVPIIWTGFRIERWEGVVLVAFYVVYVAFLVLDANDHSAAGAVGTSALVVAPLVILGFSVTGVQAWRRHVRSTDGGH